MDSVEFLKKVSLFKSLDEEQIKECAGIAKKVFYGEKEKIISEGDVSTSIYIIQSGLVHISKEIGNTEKLLAALRNGDFFGEICMFDSGIRSATAVAIARSELLEIKKEAFDDLINRKPQIGAKLLYAMMREMARRLRGSDEMVKNWIMWVKAVQEASKS
ncbi:MAG: cyclic nucleotide-binding domain-containing protein [Candidatus Omnitrophota bacterium]|nr:cyclic nucleotide-binding domain-containing protein [Candidatus Omnitrophota bacterium]